MSRVFTSGFEIADEGSVPPVTMVVFDGGSSNTSEIRLQGSIVRSGLRALERLSGTSIWRSNFTQSATGSNDRTIYTRVYFRIEQPATTTAPVLSYVDPSGTILARFLVTNTMKARLDDGTTQIGSDSSASITLGTWHMLELAMRPTTVAGTEYAEARLDGVSFASSSTLTSWTTNPVGVILGSATAAIGRTTYYDDLAVNHGEELLGHGGQVTFPGPGKIVLLKPIADVQVGSWTGGSGGTTNLFEAVNNTPPIGTSAKTDATQIQSTDDSGNNTTDRYLVALTTYQDAGISSQDRIAMIFLLANHAEEVLEETKSGTLSPASNPFAGGTAYTFGEGLGAQGPWPSGWAWAFLAEAPEVGIKTSESLVLDVRTNNPSTPENSVRSIDFLGAYVDYVPNPGPSLYSGSPPDFTTFERSRSTSW